jgi:hypothetical protein
MKGNSKGKPGKPNIKPPDLWIHHDQMELKALEKTQSGAGVGGGDGPSGVPITVTTLPRTSGGQDFESGDPHHHSNSLDKRTYVSSYIGKANNIQNSLLYVFLQSSTVLYVSDSEISVRPMLVVLVVQK